MSFQVRRRLSGEQRRALLLEAAGRLFGEHGYTGTRLEDVAAAGGVTKPILYRHFGSKKTLYLALLERHREDLGTLAGAMPADGRPDDRLRAVLDHWLAYVEDHSYAWKMLFRDSGGGPEIEAYRYQVNAQARRVLVAVIRSQSQVAIPRRQLEPLAELMSMGMASLVLWWIDNPRVTRATILDAMTRAWLGILSPNRPAA